MKRFARLRALLAGSGSAAAADVRRGCEPGACVMPGPDREHRSETPSRPLLVVVTGRPGSGKTTLARQLAPALCCPLLCRDDLKEGLCVTHGLEHASLPADTNARLYALFFQLLECFLANDLSVVAEAAFQHHRWAPKLEELAPFCDLRIVRCVVDPQLAMRRADERGRANPRRERFHRDFDEQRAPGPVRAPRRFDAVDLDVPTLDVRTDEGCAPDLAAIVAFATAGRTT